VQTSFATLNGAATDDGLPNPPGVLSVNWSQVAGPAFVTFSAPQATQTGVFFNRAGVYRVMLSANDGELVRTFGYVGQTGDVTSWHGDPDPAERAAGLPATFADEESTVLVSEQDVLRVADGWSIDPARLDGRQAPGPLRVGAAD
jgi:hypothetical protein